MTTTTTPARKTTHRIIEGIRMPIELRGRDSRADEVAALANRSDHDALMSLHALGYDMSTARVRRFTA